MFNSKKFIFILIIFMMVNYQNCFAQQTKSWLTNGNIASSSDFIGTTNTQAFILKSNNNEWMRITPDGNVGISTTSPKYKLDVHGSIRATKEIIVEKIDSLDKWPDFVFNPDYNLQLFNTRLELIKSQKHLPYIPSKDEINSNGLQISETISGLVRNIEELYLYIEQMEKRIQLLEEENKQLKEKIKNQ
ncbi:MAG TPA: hypothetical protein PLQ91_03075 [Bacteroidales bacterium]|nr:hypothetical protein [Bacteroidales bacterium]HXK90766.1 hypothetical protein [Bacteroidales bacterium]